MVNQVLAGARICWPGYRRRLEMRAMLHSLLVFALCRNTATIGKISVVPVVSVLAKVPAVMAPQTALTAVTKVTVVGVPSQITDALY